MVDRSDSQQGASVAGQPPAGNSALAVTTAAARLQAAVNDVQHRHGSTWFNADTDHAINIDDIRVVLSAVAQPHAISNPVGWFYAFSEDAEWWTIGGESYEATLAKAMSDRDDQPIYIQQARRLVPILTDLALADNIIDQIQDDECWGEDGFEGQGDLHDLQRRLDSAVAGWFADTCSLTGAQLDFFGEQTVIPAAAERRG